ncbi:hypothetical protein ACFC1T_30865 [Kitasatospora sp. NPDC056076]|uniref:hypothetical protein n=1 Tax=Kitasatospora sp. NPDC056076 TaxID=3345703 RepID=UPI0035DDD23B
MNGTDENPTPRPNPVPHPDLVLRARIQLLISDHWALDGEEGLWVYRTLFAVNPRAHAYHLTRVLLGLSDHPRLADQPHARRALLHEAVDAAAHIPTDAPWHQTRYEQFARGALTRLDQEGRTPRPDSST